MRLTELNPRWVTTDLGRHGMGISFDCPGPCCMALQMPQRLSVLFDNPIDGGPEATIAHSRGLRWMRTGETFEDLSLRPSIDASASGHWHGWIEFGEVR